MLKVQVKNGNSVNLNVLECTKFRILFKIMISVCRRGRFVEKTRVTAKMAAIVWTVTPCPL